MKKIITLLLCALLSSVLIYNTAWAGRGANCQVRQQQRIRQGINNGELTVKEVRHLKREQMQIQKHKRKALRDDTLTPRECRRLENLQDKASRPIYKNKHNNRQDVDKEYGAGSSQ